MPEILPVTLPVTLPVKFAEIVPAEKSPDTSLDTIVFVKLVLVALLANNSAVWILEAVEPPTKITVGKVAVPPKSPAN